MAETPYQTLSSDDRRDVLRVAGSCFHPLTGDRVGRYSVRLTVNVWITSGWDGDGAVDADMEDR